MNSLKKIFSIVTSDVSEDKTFYLILALSSLIWIAGFCVLSAYTIAAVFVIVVFAPLAFLLFRSVKNNV